MAYRTVLACVSGTDIAITSFKKAKRRRKRAIFDANLTAIGNAAHDVCSSVRTAKLFSSTPLLIGHAEKHSVSKVNAATAITKAIATNENIIVDFI